MKNFARVSSRVLKVTFTCAALLGVLLIAACFGYLADSLTPLLLPSYEHVVGRIANIPLTLGEPAIILWLLIRGAKDQPLKAAA